MQKLARRRSEDPTQEALREHKAVWNEACKALITGLIFFKRGLNGWGESKIGLPPSKITEPFPHEIGSYLDKLAQSLNDLISDAGSIVQEQQHYSETRRRPMVMSASVIDYSLIKNASWMGSRAWAHLRLKNENKKQLMQVLSASANLYKYFKDAEDLFGSKNPKAIPKLVNSMDRLIRIFLIRIVEKIQNISPPLPPKPPTKAQLAAAQKAKEKEERIRLKQQITEKEKIPISALEGIEKIEKDMNFFSLIINYLQNVVEGVDKEVLKKMRFAYQFISKSIGKPDADEILITQLYEEALFIAANILELPEVKSFSELQQKIKLSYLFFSDPIIKKFAGNALTRIFNRGRLKIFPNEEDNIRASCIEDLHQLLEQFDKLMDAIEKNSSIEDIQAIVRLIGYSLYVLCGRAVDLARIFNTRAEDQKIEDGKEAESKKITINMITTLRSLQRELQQKAMNIGKWPDEPGDSLE